METITYKLAGDLYEGDEFRRNGRYYLVEADAQTSPYGAIGTRKTKVVTTERTFYFSEWTEIEVVA